MTVKQAFFLGALTGIIFDICQTQLFALGAQSACKDLAHAECKLLWVPISKSNDEVTK